MFSFSSSTRGQGLLEYALLIALIAIVIVLALTFFGQGVYALYDLIAVMIPSP
jgi:Flp pilus assembly pilin Flp